MYVNVFVFECECVPDDVSLCAGIRCAYNQPTLQADASHYVIPDVPFVESMLDLLEDHHLKNIIFTGSALWKVEDGLALSLSLSLRWFLLFFVLLSTRRKPKSPTEWWSLLCRHADVLPVAALLPHSSPVPSSEAHGV